MFILQHNTQQDPEQLRQIPSAPKTASKRLSKQCDDQWFCKGYSGSQSWILDKNFDFGHSRNNDCRVIDDKELVNVLGRYNRNIDTFNLETGKYNSSHTRGKDPAGQVLSDLNHVYGVQVESLELPGVQELWLPCGFHGDKVNKEISSSYARILNLADKTIRLGPALPIAGGACSALGLEIEGPGTPKHICTFGGTLGSHDSGKFLPNCTCYDRVRQSWSALPALPYGLDHSNAILHHAGTCPSSSARASETANLVNSVRDNIGAHPARILVTNFRTVNYGKGSSFYGPGQSQILALDVPGLGTAPVDLAALHKGPGWYVFADPGAAVASVLPHSMQEMLETEGAEKGKGQEMKGGMGGPKGSKSVDGKRELGAWVNIGRDAAGMVSAGGSRYIISLGGVTAYEYQTRSKESWDAAWKDVGVAHSIPQGGEGTMNVILDQVSIHRRLCLNPSGLAVWKLGIQSTGVWFIYSWMLLRTCPLCGPKSCLSGLKDSH